MTLRQTLQGLLRRSGLLPLAEDLRLFLQRLRVGPENARFRATHPDFAVPPLPLLYEIGGRIRLAAYREEGAQSSLFLATRVKEWLGTGPVKMLDWGCGVACVVRHMPDHFPKDSAIFASDYNSAMISWAQQAIPGVQFSKNELLPPLPLGDAVLDWAYGLSVITHLGEPALRAWLDEFHRILKPGGILTLTTNGTGCEDLFSSAERETYHSKGIIVRGGLDEGRKMFLAYHSPAYFRRTVSDTWDILDFSPKGMPVTGQDLWWLRRK